MATAITMERCWDCNGLGEVPSGYTRFNSGLMAWRVCPKCDGAGEVAVKAPQPDGGVAFLLAMTREVMEEATEQLVAKLTGEERDPFDDARIVLESLGVPTERIAAYVVRLRRQVNERAHRVIAERYPEPERTFHVTCVDCNGSGIASYGYCKRCNATGFLEVPVTVYRSCRSVEEIVRAAR